MPSPGTPEEVAAVDRQRLRLARFCRDSGFVVIDVMRLGGCLGGDPMTRDASRYGSVGLVSVTAGESLLWRGRLTCFGEVHRYIVKRVMGTSSKTFGTGNDVRKDRFIENPQASSRCG